ncbi:MAG: hypothetical protein ACI90U_000622 [Pseudomonadales bacterium]|jgi:hypothetical protein
MFSLFKPNEKKRLQKIYSQKLEQALHFQRNGNIRKYSELTTEAETVKLQLDQLAAKEA